MSQHISLLAKQNKIDRSLSARAVKNLRAQAIALLEKEGKKFLHVEWGRGEVSALESSPMGRLLHNLNRYKDLRGLGIEEHTNRTEPKAKSRLVGVVGGNAENYAHHYYLIGTV